MNMHGLTSLTQHHGKHDDRRHCLRRFGVHDRSANEQPKALGYQGDQHCGKPIGEEGPGRQPQASLHALWGLGLPIATALPSL